MDEYLDIVDENNWLTGQKELRSVVHATGLWHRVVKIHLYRKVKDDIEFVFHLRSPFKDLCPDKWSISFGGHVVSGKTLAEGIISEVKDEVGLDVDIDNLYDHGWFVRDLFPNREFVKAYFLEYTGSLQDLKFNDGEVQTVKWMSQKEIRNAFLTNPNDWASRLEGFEEVAGSFIKKILA